MEDDMKNEEVVELRAFLTTLPEDAILRQGEVDRGPSYYDLTVLQIGSPSFLGQKVRVKEGRFIEIVGPEATGKVWLLVLNEDEKRREDAIRRARKHRGRAAFAPGYYVKG